MKFNLNQQTSKPANQQTSKPANQQTSKPANQQFKFLKIIGVFMVFLLVFACDKDPITEISSENKTDNLAGRPIGNVILAEFENGRLVFDSQNDFDQTIAALKKLDETGLKNAFDDAYKAGFVPLYPYYQGDEEKTVNLLQKRIPLLPRELKDGEYQLSDPLISDDLFASLLNYKREIVLEKEIYKYTFSGALIAAEKDSTALKRYVSSNNINDFIPDPQTLPAGRVSLTSKIDSYVNPTLYTESNCFVNLQGKLINGSPFHVLTHCDPNYELPGYNSGGNPPSPNPNYTSSLITYIDGLQPCHTQNGTINVFGTIVKCFEYFSSGDRQTKTKYSHMDYVFYEGVTVKVKHRERKTFGISWWEADRTDEVALVIKDAIFKISSTNMSVPLPLGVDMENEMLFYSKGKIIDPTATLPQTNNWPVPNNKYPSTPFDEEVIVTVFNDNLGDAFGNISNDQVTDLFWNSVYDLAVQAGNMVDTGGETTKITMLLNTPTSTIVHYVDLSRRVSNTKKIKNTLAQDWGGTISFNMSLDAFGQIITDPTLLSGVEPPSISVNVDAGGLLNFETLYIDFTGVSRRGSEWRGSKLVFTEN